MTPGAPRTVAARAALHGPRWCADGRRVTRGARYARRVRLAVVVLFALGCGSSKTERAPTPPPPTPVRAHDAAPAPAATLDVRADRRVELIAILQRLAGAKEYAQAAPSPYVAAVDRHFAAHATHPAVAATAALRQQHGIGFDAPMLLAIHLDARYELVHAAELATIDKRFAGVDVAAYAAAVRAFAADTGFDAFFAAAAPHYEAATAPLRALVEQERPIAWFDATLGPRPRTRYAAIVGMLTGGHSYGPRATLADGTTELVQILGQGTATSTPRTPGDTVALLVHELAHSYVNPVFAQHHAALAASGTALYGLVAPRMRSENYASWQTMLDESGVRALTVLYVRDRRGDVAGAAAARAEQRVGFVWINELVDVFRKHARDRAGAGLDAAMPQVIAFFDGLAAQYGGALPRTPFIGPINAAIAADVAVVGPSARGDATLARYAQAVHAKVFPASPYRAADDGTLAALPGRNVIAYGSPATNPVVAAVAEWASWKIAPDRIELGKRVFPGKDLVLIACWFRRDDPTKAVIVYTSANDRDVVQANSLHHGPTDWVIGRRAGARFEIVAKGDWTVVNGAWVPPE